MDERGPCNDSSPDRGPDCLFCSEKVRARALAENGTVFAIKDAFPVTPGHILLIPRRDGDVDEPMGGVRGVVAGRRAY